MDHGSDIAMAVLGVPGRLTHRTAKEGKAPGLWFKQRWISELRPAKGRGERIRAEIRYDDELGNGHNTFAMTCSTYDARGKNTGGGAAHEEIARAFPELAPLVRWHLVSSNGPMHYIGNTVYMAGDRDHFGMAKGEKRHQHTRDGQPMWELHAVNADGMALKLPANYAGADTVPVYALDTLASGPNPPATPRLEWAACFRVGEGKERELDKARNAACWPDATDAELMAEPAELRAKLAQRLPGLMDEFFTAVSAAGFLPAVPGSASRE